MPSISATPQVLVIGRSPTLIDDTDYRPIFKEKLIYRIVGRFPIENWVNRGLPLPQDILDEFGQESTSPRVRILPSDG